MSDFPEKASDQTNSFAIIVVGLATTAVLWASVLALQAYFHDTAGDFVEKRAAEGRADAFDTLQSAQVSNLMTSKFADRNKGQLKRLSIDRAKLLVVRDAKEVNAKPRELSLIPTLGPLIHPSVLAVPGKATKDSLLPVPTPTATTAGTDPAAGAGATPAAPTPAAPAPPSAPSAVPASPAAP